MMMVVQRSHAAAIRTQALFVNETRSRKKMTHTSI